MTQRRLLRMHSFLMRITTRNLLPTILITAWIFILIPLVFLKEYYKHEGIVKTLVGSIQKRQGASNEKTQHSREDDMQRHLLEEDDSHLPQKWCSEVLKLPTTVPSDTFQHVGGSDMYIYSAYQDRRGGTNIIRLIGIAPIDPGTFYCEFTYSDRKVLSTRAQNVLTSVDLELHKDFLYKPYLIYCNETRSRDVAFVSITTKHCVVPSNILKVKVIPDLAENDIEDSMAVCLRTMHHIHSPYSIVEFMELQKYLGVNHVYAYGAENVSPEVEAVLDYYTKAGTLTIYAWNLPVKNSPVFDKPGEIAIHGQHALNNDCLYRHMDTHRLLFMHDMDEYFIPRSPHVKTSRDLLRLLHVIPAFKGPFASYFFINCYFCLEKEDLQSSTPQLVTVNKQNRHICLKPEMEKAWRENPKAHHIEGGRKAAKKALVYPLRTVQMGVHGVIEALPGYNREVKVGTYYAVMHHYKRPVDIPCETVDTTVVDKYSNILKTNVNRVCEVLNMEPVP